MLGDFRLFLLAATLATVIGAFLVPTFQRYFSRAVVHFHAHRSMPRLVLHAFSRGGLSWLRDGVSLPAAANVTQLPAGAGVSWKVVVLNVLAMALWSFCRFYYFAFYVIEHYVDPGWRFSGLWSFFLYLLRKQGKN